MRKIDITNYRYGKLIALKEDPLKGKSYWIFKCDCGNTKSLYKKGVVQGKTKSCGCLARQKKINKKGFNILGKKFNKLIVLNFTYIKNKDTYWKCKCDCGNETIVSYSELISNGTKSCGCFRITKNEPGVSGLKRIYLIYKKTANQKNREFNLTLDEFKEITSKNCAYCGSEPSTESFHKYHKTANNIKEHTIYKYNGIDRIDSTKGYEKDNIVPCCKICNYMKNNNTLEEFKKHIIMVYKHLNKLK